MVEYLRLEIDGEDALDHGERDIHATVAPSKFNEILQTEDSAVFSIFCLTNGSIKVVIESVDEALSGGGGGGVQSFPEPDDRVKLLVTRIRGIELN